jgi:hypothetical protein
MKKISSGNILSASTPKENQHSSDKTEQVQTTHPLGLWSCWRKDDAHAEDQLTMTAEETGENTTAKSSLPEQNPAALWRRDTRYRFLHIDAVKQLRFHYRSRVNQTVFNSTRARRPSIGFVFETTEPLEAGLLVEIDIRLDEALDVYRAVGVIAWTADTLHNDRLEVGMSVLWMSKPGADDDSPGNQLPRPGFRSRKTVAERKDLPITEHPVAATAAETAVGFVQTEPPPPEQPVQTSSRSATEQPAQSPASEPPVAQRNTSEPAAAAYPVPSPESERLDKLLPGPKDISELFTGLLGEEATVEQSDEALLTRRDMAAVGVYLSETDTVTALFALDLPLSVSMGACLSMIPSGVATESIKMRTLKDEIRDNLSEILNVSASLLNRSNQNHHRFSELQVILEQAPPENVAHLLEKPLARKDYAIAVSGYKEGIMSIMIVEDGTI